MVEHFITANDTDSKDALRPSQNSGSILYKQPEKQY